MLKAIIVILNQEENLGGIFVAMMKFIIAIEIEAALALRGQLLQEKSFDRQRRKRFERCGQQQRRGRRSGSGNR